MKNSDLHYDGIGHWTEPGAWGGLDPLGMRAPIESCFARLLPGLTTVTNRLRYYSFFSWWIRGGTGRVVVVPEGASAQAAGPDPDELLR